MLDQAVELEFRNSLSSRERKRVPTPRTNFLKYHGYWILDTFHINININIDIDFNININY